ncbi:MAG: hypothetical protein RL477_854 [Pseudomonadota bacterium]|jgi:hypothetical protein
MNDKMNDVRNDGGERKYDSPERRPQAERDLDRMLDLLSAPAPSETLRARLKRDFSADGGKGAAESGTVGILLRQRAGAFAVAAALLLAVALAALSPPVGERAPATGVPAAEAAATYVPDEATADPDEAAADEVELARAMLGGASADSAPYLFATLVLARHAEQVIPDDAGWDASASFDAVPLD